MQEATPAQLSHTITPRYTIVLVLKIFKTKCCPHDITRSGDSVCAIEEHIHET